jgi:hypothetical protein
MMLRFNDKSVDWYSRRMDLHVTGKVEISASEHDIWVHADNADFAIPVEACESIRAY